MRTVKRPKVLPSAGRSGYQVSHEVKLEGKALLTQGAEISIKGQRGRFRFDRHVVTDAGASWITVWGPIGADGQRAQWRSFGPSSVRSVHRVTKARPKSR